MHRAAVNAEHLKSHNFNYYQKKLSVAFILIKSKSYHCLCNDVNFHIFPVLGVFRFSYKNRSL